MTDPPPSFNLWHAPWIRVTRLDGGDAELGIGACLAKAHDLAALSDPSPLVVGGTHRLLAAILQAIYAPRDLGEIADLLRAGQFDPARLAQFADQYADRFDLFHPSHPFLQTGDVPLDGWKKPGKGQKHDWGEAKPIGYLFPEVPTVTNRTHYHHVADDSYRICPTCCARGIITIPAFAMSGGSGIRPSINADPPIYIFPAGMSLFESLGCSIVASGFIPRTADPRRMTVSVWDGEPIIHKGLEVSAVGYLESLLFPARRIRIYPQTITSPCNHCGRTTYISIGLMLFEMGHWLSKGTGTWEDPFTALRKPRGRSKTDDPGLKPIRPEEGKAVWREYTSLLLAEQEAQLRPGVVRQVAKLIDRWALSPDQRLRFRCVGVRNPSGKATVYEWLDEALEAPPALLTDDDAATSVDTALQRADEIRFVIESSFDGHFRPERDRGGRDAKLARFKTVRARMTTDYWQRLAPRFRVFINGLANEGRRDQVAAAWVDALVREGRGAFDAAAEQIGTTAEALRARVEAQAACHRRLNSKRKEWSDEQS